MVANNSIGVYLRKILPESAAIVPNLFATYVNLKINIGNIYLKWYSLSITFLKEFFLEPVGFHFSFNTK